MTIMLKARDFDLNGAVLACMSDTKNECRNKPRQCKGGIELVKLRNSIVKLPREGRGKMTISAFSVPMNI